MLMSMFTIMISSIAINLFFMINPLSLGISILIMALLISMLFSYSLSSWVAFLIFLIYVSGMLVMFAYFISMTPNLTINMPSIILLLSMSSILLMTSNITMNMFPQTNMLVSPQYNILYLNTNYLSLLMLATILLITMIIVIKVSIYSKGPLRPFNYV